jgi:Tripartite tricarboxylate transporter TctB family
MRCGQYFNTPIQEETMHIKSQKDFFSGLMFAAVGAAFAIGASTYNVGNGARMGPGYFPLMLGILLAVIGLVITFTSMVIEAPGGDKIGKIAWKPLFFVISANIVFGILLAGIPAFGIPAMGLIVAIYALVFIASMAEAGWKFRTTLILATVLAVGSYLAFVVALKLQFPVWPFFIAG